MAMDVVERGSVTGNGAEVTSANERKTLDSTLAAGTAGVVIYNGPNGKTAGMFAGVMPNGALKVSNDGGAIFMDTFDGSTLDNVIRWNSAVLAGTGTHSITNSASTLATGTTAANAAAISTRPTFVHNGFGWLELGFGIQLESAGLTNTHRFWGLGTPNASFTAATPMADAMGFEIGIDGLLYAVVYAGNARTWSQALTRPSDGAYHAYGLVTRSDKTLFYVDDLNIPVASGPNFVGPNVATLPIRQHMINHTSGPASAPTFNSGAIGLSDSAGNTSLIGDGNNPFVKARVGADGGLRVTPRPVDHATLGAYCIGMRTGVMAAALAANAEIFQFRWSNAANLAVIRKIRISAGVSTTFFAAGVPLQIDLIKCTGWSAAGSGGTRASPAALLKRRTSMGSSLVAASDIGIASTAGLTAGTKTLETLALSSIVAACPITASLNGAIIDAGTILWQAEVGDGEHPLVLAQNEGFVITVPGIPATGTWTAAITVDWAEVQSY